MDKPNEDPPPQPEPSLPPAHTSLPGYVSQSQPVQPVQPVQAQPGAYPPTGYPLQQPGAYPLQQPGAYPVAAYTPQVAYVPQQNVASTVVVTTQPQQQQLRDWSSGLCDCFNDFGTCCYGMYCASCLLLQISNRMGEGCCLPSCCPYAMVTLRVKLRTEHHIEGSIMDDFVADACCYQCALCQMSRELDYLGL